MESSVNTDILRGRVDTIILNSLSEKDGYGYDILNYIFTKTQGHYEMKQSSIYSVLKRLEKQGFITSYVGDESNGGKRRYYSLTEQGRNFLKSEQNQWAYTRTLLDNLVTTKNFDLEKDIPPFKASDLRPLTKRIKNESNEDNEPQKENKENEDMADNENYQPEENIELQKTEETFEENSNNKDRYRDILSDIYNKEKINNDIALPKKEEDIQLDCHHINDLKNLLKNEGYVLKSYKKNDEIPENTKNFIKINKLLRDTSLMTYLFFVLTVLIVFKFQSSFNYSSKTLLIIGTSGLIVPLICFILYLANPNRKIKKSFNFKLSLIYAIMLFLIVYIINIIVCLLSPNFGLTSIFDLRLYPPIIFATAIPFSVVAFKILLSSKIYQ